MLILECVNLAVAKYMSNWHKLHSAKMAFYTLLVGQGAEGSGQRVFSQRFEEALGPGSNRAKTDRVTTQILPIFPMRDFAARVL
jgi:hypothetical protein